MTEFRCGPRLVDGLNAIEVMIRQLHSARASGGHRRLQLRDGCFIEGTWSERTLKRSAVCDGFGSR